MCEKNRQSILIITYFFIVFFSSFIPHKNQCGKSNEIFAKSFLYLASRATQQKENQPQKNNNKQKMNYVIVSLFRKMTRIKKSLACNTNRDRQTE